MKIYKIIPVMALAILLSSLIISCGGNTKGVSEGQDSLSVELININNKISSEPKNAVHYDERARYFLKNQNHARALEDVRKAITIDSTQSGFYQTLGDIYLATDKFTNCESAYLKALKISPDNVQGLLKLAKFRIIFKSYEEAFSLIEKAVKIDKFSADAYYLAGFTFMEKGDTLSAIKNYLTATELNQNHYDSYIRLGILYSAKHEKLAEGYFKNALRIRPGDQAAHYLLGLFYQENGFTEKAISTYDALLTINPDYRDAWFNMGYIQMSELFDFVKAIEYYNKALELDAAYADAFMNRGYCYERLGNYDNAEADYKKVLSLRPNYPKAIDGLNRLK